MTAFPQFSPEYRERFVSQELWLDRTLHDYFAEAVEKAPDQVALIEGDRRVTFSQWDAMAERAAAGLTRLGLGKGDIVTVQLPNWIEMCVSQIALSRIGAVIQPMHTVYREREMASMLEFCNSRAILLPQEYAGFAHADAAVALQPELPQLDHVVVVRGEASGALSWDELLASTDGLAAHEKAHPVHADDVFYLNFTSGTEGAPKGFLHTHNTMLSVLKRFADMQTEADPSSKNDVLLANSPMTHSFGHLSTYQLLLRQVRMVLVERFSPSQTLRLIADERVSSISGTPAHLISILHHADFEKTDTSCINSVGVGGSQCPPQLMADIEKHFGVRVGNMYGMGENILHTRTMPTDSHEIIRETVGMPVPGAELKIFAADHAREQPQGEVGEIAFRGPTLFLGYYRNPERTAETRNDDGWFFTGDLGFVDERGYLHMAGRKKEQINRGGTKIFPKEIEDLLHSHPSVQKAAVVGMPDYRLGERVCAYLELERDSAVTLDELREFLTSKQVMKHKIPERLEIVSELPQTPTGKIQKGPLVEDIKAKLEAEAGSAEGG
ncbi:MAG: AMP-binding protein [Candidatus Binatia bacterium]|nr:AMP-binding protein [Candidatus Binatia bacterium]